MFRNPFGYTGRITRTEYVISKLIVLILFITVAMIHAYLGNILWFTLLVPVFWFDSAQLSKRFHDYGENSPYFSRGNFVALLMKGDNRDNEYGTNPRKPEK